MRSLIDACKITNLGLFSDPVTYNVVYNIYMTCIHMYFIHLYYMQCFTCIITYIQAQRPDELDIVEGEELEVLEWDDGDGWCKGKNSGSREGYFPQSYVQPISRPTSPTASTGTTNPPSTCSHQMSVSSTTSTLTVTSLSLSPAHSHTNGTSKWSVQEPDEQHHGILHRIHFYLFLPDLQYQSNELQLCCL